MDLHPSSEEQQVVEMAAGFLAKAYPATRLHEEDCGRYSRDIASAFAELGLFGTGLAEDEGGVGLGIVCEALIFREFGRQLAPLAVLPTCLAARVSAASGNIDLVHAFLSGEARVALAWPDPNLTQARLFEIEGADYVLDLEGEVAAILPIDGIIVDALPCLDKSVSMGRAEIDRGSAVAECKAEPILTTGRLMSSAMLVGGCEAMTDMITEYAKIRETFGRPIGAYQAVRHPIAEMAVRTFAARCQLFLAAVSLRDGTSDAALQVDAAKAMANDAAIRNSDANLQLHGGISTTDEHDSHLYMKRAHLLVDLFGNRTVLERLLATSLGA